MKLVQLIPITEPTPIDTLTEAQLKELQTALSRLGYPVGEGDDNGIDGLIGPRTRTAWAEFKTDVFQGNPDLIGPGSVKTLQLKSCTWKNRCQNHDYVPGESSVQY